MDDGHLDVLRLVHALFVQQVLVEVCDSLAMAVLVELCYDYLLFGFLAFDEVLVDRLDLLDHRLLAQDHLCG